MAIDSLRARAEPTKRSLAEALARPGARFILEIKKASPSAGAIRANADPAAIARGYAGVADALSVLTDTTYFGGTTSDVTGARGAFDGPILAKDFFLDPRLRQVIETGLANNRDLRIAAGNVLQARAQLRVQRSDLLPTATVSGTGTYTNNVFGAPGAGAAPGAGGDAGGGDDLPFIDDAGVGENLCRREILSQSVDRRPVRRGA